MGSHTKKLVAAYTKIAIILLNTIVLFFLIELSCSIFFLSFRMYAHFINNTNTSSTSNKRWSAILATYPDKTEKEVFLIRRTMETKLQQVYAPWVQFKTPNWQGNYINIKGLVRKSIPSLSHPKSSRKPFTIYFFGGSTMFGFNVADCNTIPSQIVLRQQACGIDALPIKAVNYGQPYYYSTHEAVALFSLLLKGHHPDAVVFMDGLNDILQITSSFRQYPFWTPRLKTIFSSEYKQHSPLLSLCQKTNTYRILHLIGIPLSIRQDTIEQSSYNMPKALSSQQIAKGIFTNYINSISAIRKTCSNYKIKCYFICQPVPFFGYDQTKDPICDKRSFPLFKAIYPKIEQRAKLQHDLFFFGNMLKNIHVQPFVDRFHYTPSFNKQIAVKIWEILQLSDNARAKQ